MLVYRGVAYLYRAKGPGWGRWVGGAVPHTPIMEVWPGNRQRHMVVMVKAWHLEERLLHVEGVS